MDAIEISREGRTASAQIQGQITGAAAAEQYETEDLSEYADAELKLLYYEGEITRQEYYFREKSWENGSRSVKIEGMEYIDLRKAGRAVLKEIRRQVVRLKEFGKTGKEIEELTGVRQNRASEIWTAYQREGSASLERKKYGRKPGSHMVLTTEEQENIRKAIVDNVPEDFEITCRL